MTFLNLHKDKSDIGMIAASQCCKAEVISHHLNNKVGNEAGMANGVYTKIAIILIWPKQKYNLFLIRVLWS